MCIRDRATDGDFNVGTVNFEALKNLVETQRKSGVALTTLGFGAGNYNAQLMHQLADAGTGNYAYIDTLQMCIRDSYCSNGMDSKSGRRNDSNGPERVSQQRHQSGQQRRQNPGPRLLPH